MTTERNEGSDEGHRPFADDLRSGEDRRSADERRIAERREHTDSQDRNRRSGTDRRSGEERRVDPDRRQQSSSGFTPEEAERIRDMVLNPTGDVACPRCDGTLLLGPLTSSASGNEREVRCTSCRGSVTIGDLREQ